MRATGFMTMAPKDRETRNLAVTCSQSEVLYQCWEMLPNRSFNPWWCIFLGCEKPEWGRRFKIKDQRIMYYNDHDCNWQTVFEIRKWSYK